MSNQKNVRTFAESGFTLIELLISLSIVASLLLFSLQGYKQAKIWFETRAVLTQLTHLIYYARSEAIRSGKPVTICKSRDGKTCSGSWSNGQIAFINTDKMHLLIALGPVKTGTLIFRAFQSSDFLRFTPKGSTFEQNGTFIYCPNGNARSAHTLIIEKSGRIKFSDEDSDGSPLKCTKNYFNEKTQVL